MGPESRCGSASKFRLAQSVARDSNWTHSDVAFAGVHDIERVLTARSEQADAGVVALEDRSIGCIPRSSLRSSRTVVGERVGSDDLG